MALKELALRGGQLLSLDSRHGGLNSRLGFPRHWGVVTPLPPHRHAP
jgi:hypothetical protein